MAQILEIDLAVANLGLAQHFNLLLIRIGLSYLCP